jgi:hypothetical protein
MFLLDGSSTGFTGSITVVLLCVLDFFIYFNLIAVIGDHGKNI